MQDDDIWVRGVMEDVLKELKRSDIPALRFYSIFHLILAVELDQVIIYDKN